VSTAHDATSADRGTPARGLDPASGLLPHIGLLRFTGPDAHAFLQGQVSNDVRRLSEGSPLLAAYSTAQGRVVALMRLLPHSSGVMALLPQDILQPTLERLRKFVLRAKVVIEDLSGQFAVIGEHRAADLGAAGLPIPDAAGYVEQDGIGIGRVSSGSGRHWVIGPAARLAEHRLARQGLDADPGGQLRAQRIERDWRLADIRAGLPQVYAATCEMFVAQMLNLDLIDGISFSKGCYTGQEIIARTQHLGRIKRRMFRLQLPPGTWSIGQALRLGDGRSGRLTELAPLGAESRSASGGEFVPPAEALAVLNLEAGAADAEAAPGVAAPGVAAPGEAVAAVQLPLPYPVGA